MGNFFHYSAFFQVTQEARAKRSAEMMRVKRNLGDANSLGVSKSPEDGGEEGQVVTEPPATAVARYVLVEMVSDHIVISWEETEEHR